MNQKTTEFKKLYASNLTNNDLVSIVDVSSTVSPTGENVYTTIGELATSMVSMSYLDYEDVIKVPVQIREGLHFDEAYAPGADKANTVYGTHNSIVGTNMFIGVRCVLPSPQTSAISSDRIIFGLSDVQTGQATRQAHTVYIGINGTSLVGYASVASTSQLPITYASFITNHSNSPVFIGLNKHGNVIDLYVGSKKVGTLDIGTSAQVFNGTPRVIMGNGTTNYTNLNCVIGEAVVINRTVTEAEIASMATGIVSPLTSGTTALYSGNGISQAPGQWIDFVGNNNLILPTSGVTVINKKSEFQLQFFVSGSGFVANGQNILPSNYMLTRCVVSSSQAPILSVGTSATLPPVSASVFDSYVNNRVPFTHAKYGINNLPLNSIGAAHPLKTLYVHFSGSAYPCKITFNGVVI